MARWGSCDFKQLRKLRDNLSRLRAMDLEKFCTDVSKELAARLLALVIPRTPVGNYKGETYTCVSGQTHHSSKVSGKNGGTLRRGWTARTEQEAAGGGKIDAKAYVQSLPIVRRGNTYVVEVINPVHYASYVEFGHRTPGGKGWVNGHYFLTLSEQDLERIAPGIIERKLEALLREAFHV